MSSNTAKCLCGAIELSASDLGADAGACHCQTCRRWGGGPLMTLESKADVTINDPNQQLGVFDSSQWAERAFCKQCGTHLFYRLKQKNHHYFSAGFFSEATPVFDHQVFIDEKPDWYAFSNETKDMTGAELFAMFSGDQES